MRLTAISGAVQQASLKNCKTRAICCKILSVDKSAEAFSLAFADRVLSRLYIAEYLVADYGSEHKALGIIRSEIKDCIAFDGYMDVIDLKSIENIDYAIKLYTDYINKIMNLVEGDAEKYKRRKALKSIIELARHRNANLYSEKGIKSMAIRREYIGSGKKFIRYSPEEMADARQTDMLDFLSRKEGFTFIKVGSVYQCNEHDSLIIQGDRQRWYWNSQNLRGLIASTGL